MGRLSGKIAIVTGASRGIGRAIAIELAREGAKVAINYQSNEEKAKEVAYEIRASSAGRACWRRRTSRTPARRAVVKKVADEWGHLDVLVNNAGITRDKSLRKMTDEDWQEVIETNLNASSSARRRRFR